MTRENFESLSKTIVKTGSFILLLSIFGKLAGYVFNMLLTKSVSTEIYGTFSLAWGVVTFSTAILLLGVPDSISRFVAFYRGEGKKENVDNTIKTGVILTLFLSLIALLILFLFNMFFPEFMSLNMNVFLLVCFLFFVRSFEGLFNAIICGFRKPHISQVMRFLLEILRPILLFVAVLSGISLFSAIFALVLSVTIPAIIAAAYEIKNFGLRGNFNSEMAKKLFKFGIPMTATSTANNILGWADMFMIRFFIGFSALGIYYIANITAAVELVFFSAFLMIFTPIITESFGKKDFEQVSKLSSYLSESFFLLCVPILLAFVTFPREILSVLFTSDYSAGALAFQIMSFSMFFYGTSNLFTTVLNSSGNPRRVSSIVSISAGTNIVLNLFFIPVWGIDGAATATAFSSVVMLVLSHNEAKKIINLKISFSRIGKILLAAFLTMPIIFLVKKAIQSSLPSLIISGFLLVLTYTVFLLLLKAFRKEDVLLLGAITRKIGIKNNITQKILDLIMSRTI